MEPVKTYNISGNILLGSLGAEWGPIAGAKIGLILAPATGGTSIVLGGVVGAGIGVVLLGVGAGFAGSYGGTTIARKYTGMRD